MTAPTPEPIIPPADPPALPPADTPPADPPPPIAASWQDGLDVEVKGHPSLADFPTDRDEAIGALAKSYVSTKEMVGKKGVILPKEGDAADRERFFNEMGRPGTVEEYDLSGFTPPEGLPWDTDAQGALVAAMHSEGATGEMVTAVLNAVGAQASKGYTEAGETMDRGRAESEKVLRVEYGAKYDAAAALGVRAFKAAAGEHSEAIENVALADGTLLGDSPEFMRVFMKIGEQYSEHGLLGDKDGGGGLLKTPETAKQEMAEIYENDAYYNKDDPQHDALVSKMDSLSKMAEPEIEIQDDRI